MDLVESVRIRLGIPRKYCKTLNFQKNDTVLAVVNTKWLVQLTTKKELPKFITHDTLSSDEVQAWLHQEKFQPPWQRILIKIISPKEDENVIPLPRSRPTSNYPSDICLSYSQLLHFISHTNYKNLWKHCFKKYLGYRLTSNKKDGHKISISTSRDILREVVGRFYGCPIITVPSNNIPKSNHIPRKETNTDAHPNILPAAAVIETESQFFIIYIVEDVKTLKDCVTFSPTILNQNYSKVLFIIYQLLQAMKDSHERGLLLGNIGLDDILINDTFFIQIIPTITNNVYEGCDFKIQNTIQTQDTSELLTKCKMNKRNKDNITISLSFKNKSLDSICNDWLKGYVTNFDYIMHLNHVSGRRFGDPTCHFIFPWITDFSTRSNGVWRDLTKSKFRLNKGDRQLDLTYDSAINSNQVPHHVSDVLSEITYYVYMARRTPKSILCKYVRSSWVPAEYPSSIQRLEAWTPDECIPELFYDPSIFKSIHEDLPDLELPPWALTPEEFIEAHREALECRYVSERLHHWVDLTFGYKLSGSAAVKSKNVCLQLVDSHINLSTTGVVQLFKQPHPQKQMTSPFFDKTPPKLIQTPKKTKSVGNSSQPQTTVSDEEAHSSGHEDDSFGTKSSPLPLTKVKSRSRGSLLASFQSTSDEQSPKETKQPTIFLPKDYNPTSLLTSVENSYNFNTKTFLQTNLSETNNIAGNELKQSFKQIVAARRIQEMHVLGCLVVEMFYNSKLRILSDDYQLDSRLKSCLRVLKHNDLPPCMKAAVCGLLQVNREPSTLNDLNCDSLLYPPVSAVGLPPPSAHLLLQPLLTSFTFPFPLVFSPLYSTLSRYTTCSRIIHLYSSLHETTDDILVLNGYRIKCLCLGLRQVWSEILNKSELTDLICPFIKDLFSDLNINKIALFHLFNKMAMCLGVKNTNEIFLDSVLELYEKSNDCMFLYDQHLLNILMVRFGLKSFLEHFIGPIVEAVGKYHDFSQVKGFHCNRKTQLKESEAEPEIEITLSPLEEDSSPEIEKKSKINVNDDVEDLFMFEKDEVKSSPNDNDVLSHIIDNLQLDSDQQSQGEDDEDDLSRPTAPVNVTGIKSPDIDIPHCSKSVFTTIECEVGSKSLDSNNTSDEFLNDGCNHSVLKTEKDLKPSHIASESICWLSIRFGPVLTARYITKNLLRMLSLCYLGKENFIKIDLNDADKRGLWKLSVFRTKVLGDDNSELVLKCLGDIIDTYGEQFILLQFFPYMSELIRLCKKKLTLNLEGGIVGCLALLKFIVPFLNDTTLMDQLQDVILKNILHPVVRLVSSTRLIFPSGHISRQTLVFKFVDTLYIIALRIGCEMSKVHLAVPSLQRFFLAFNKAYCVETSRVGSVEDGYLKSNDNKDSPIRSLDDRLVEIHRDGTSIEWCVRGTGLPGLPVSFSHVKSYESTESYSPPVDQHDSIRHKAINELKQVFTAELAHLTYLPFFKFLGSSTMESTLKNQQLIRGLCFEYEQFQTSHSGKGVGCNQMYLSHYLAPSDSTSDVGGSASFGSNTAVIGNKIELHRVDIPGAFEPTDGDVVSLTTKKTADAGRHLRGNWLAYWEHEIGRSEKDMRFNFKQIKLQTFTGHSNSIKSLLCLDNENSFISGSRDKTVKLWSLRSQGDGSQISACQFTYTRHKKSLLSLTYVDTLGLVASCDSTIHFWDPFTGKCIGVLENAKYSPVNVVKLLQPSSCNIVAGTTDSTLKIIDTRTVSYACEFKVSSSQVGLIRSISVSSNGNWLVVGQASGTLTVLDVRTGTIISAWKGHEGEVLQLASVGDQMLISSSLDQSVSVWSTEGKLKCQMKGPTEPVHCLCTYNQELISGTTANRIGVHTSFDDQASFSSTKLRSDTFKGVLTTMTILPLNKLLLLGGDGGNITLLC